MAGTLFSGVGLTNSHYLSSNSHYLSSKRAGSPKLYKMLASRKISTSTAARAAPIGRRSLTCRSSYLAVNQILSLADGAPGSVDAPIGVVIGGWVHK